MRADAPPFTTDDLDQFAHQLDTAEPADPTERVTVVAEPAPPAPDEQQAGGEDGGMLSISVAAFTASGPHLHSHMHLDEPAAPAEIVAAVRACASGVLAQMGIDPAAHGGLGPRP